MVCSERIVYDRVQLLGLYSTAAPTSAVSDGVRNLGLWATCHLRCVDRRTCFTRPACDRLDGVFVCRYRGRRSGRLRAPVNEQRAERHSAPPASELSFGCFNVRSLTNKLDDVLEIRRDQLIDVLFLTETWHDTDSVCLRRLRADGFQVIDRPRPRLRDDTMATNHGGIAAVAMPGIRLSLLNVGAKPTTFEFLCVRVSSGSSTCVAAIIYRPGSDQITSAFFDDIADVLDRLATFVDPVFLVGDANIRLDRPDTPSAVRFVEILAAHGLANRVDRETHDRHGWLDIVATRDDLPPPRVDVIDVGLSDHRLLQWSSTFTRSCPVYTTVTSRPWSRLRADVFRAALASSRLCRPASWSGLGVEELSKLYDSELTDIADRLVPSRTVRYRRRPSDPWFDDDCRVAKRCVRMFERDARRMSRAVPLDAVAAAAAAAATTRWTQRRRDYRALLREKRETFWQSKVTAEQSTPRQLWRSIDVLLGRGSAPSSSAVTADDIHQFFDDKVAGIQASTSGAPPPSFTDAPPGCHLGDFRLLSIDDVTAAVRQLPDKQCSSDPLPTRRLKDNVDLLAPFLVELFNQALQQGVTPTTFKSAYITPLLKKSDLDPADVKSYRPISNLSVLSKLLERLVARQLLEYLTASRLLPDLQSAYRAFHSTETAVLKVMSDILQAIDSGNLAVLTLLDLSAAFDTVDHTTLLRRLEASYGLRGTVISWFRSYLDGRTQFVYCGSRSSKATRLRCGVPQGSVLGPILFLLYTADLLRVIRNHNLLPHLYADDTQIYGSCSPGSTAELQGRVSACIDEVAVWMKSNRLQLNTAKTEVIWCSSARRQHQIPDVPLMVGPDAVSPVRSVRDLGIYIDSDLSMKAHVSKTISGCFAALRQIRSIRRSLTRPVLKSLVASLVLSRLDYGIATLAGLPARQLNRLQSVLNAAARLVCHGRKYDHITPLLYDLHWLRVPERITFRLSVLVYRCQCGQAPSYLADELHRIADDGGRQGMRSASTASLLVPATKRSTIGDRAFPVAAARAWNSLSAEATSSPSLTVFKRQLKTELFRRSFPRN